MTRDEIEQREAIRVLSIQARRMLEQCRDKLDELGVPGIPDPFPGVSMKERVGESEPRLWIANAFAAIDRLTDWTS